MALPINKTDLAVVAGDLEPRVQDLRLAECLEFERPRAIRQLIERYKDELETYAGLPQHVANPTALGGRPGNEYWLTEAQAILICMRSDAPQAASVRAELIAVFQAWRRGELIPIADLPTLTGAIRDLFHETVAPIAQKVDALDKKLSSVATNVVQLFKEKNSDRKDASPETVRQHLKVILYHYDGMCPCNECNIQIADNDGFISGSWAHHHQYNRWKNAPTEMIPLAKECHERIEKNNEARKHFGVQAFPQFQNLLSRLPERAPRFPFPDGL